MKALQKSFLYVFPKMDAVYFAFLYVIDYFINNGIVMKEVPPGSEAKCPL